MSWHCMTSHWKNYNAHTFVGVLQIQKLQKIDVLIISYMNSYSSVIYMVIHVVVRFTWLPWLQCTRTAVHWQIWLIVRSRSFAECPNTPLSIATGRHYTIAIFTLQPIQNNPVDIGRLVHPERRTDEECYHNDNPVEWEEGKGGGRGGEGWW